MELRLTESQTRLQSGIRKLLEQESPVGRSRAAAKSEAGFSGELWHLLAEEGYLGIPFEKRLGGGGLGFLEASLVLEELGRFRVPSPYLTTILVTGLAIDRWGTDAQRSEHLRGIISGNRIAAYADAEPGGSWGADSVRLQARRSGDEFVLNGRKAFVPYAHVADLLLVAARESGDGPPVSGDRRPAASTADGARIDSSGEAVLLFLVAPKTSGVSIDPIATVDYDRYCTVDFKDVRLPGSALLGGSRGDAKNRTSVIEQLGAAGRCAEMVGGAERVLEMSVEFAKKRRQFGRPIGSFQAIQHRCADMAVDAVSSRLLAREAAWRLGRGLTAGREVSIAKAWVGEAYHRICLSGHQIHGAIGYTSGHSMHLFYRHARAAELQFGDSAYHRELLARMIGM